MKKYIKIAVLFLMIGTITLFIIILLVRKDKNDLDIRIKYNINIEDAMDDKRDFYLSEIADSIEYLVLETPKDLIITSIRKVILDKENIFVLAKGVVYRFNRKGKFIQQIGSRGKGPGEFGLISDFYIIPEKDEIGLMDYPVLIYYSYEGLYLKTITATGEYISQNDSNLWISAEPLGYYSTILVGYNSFMDTINTIENSEFYNEKKAVIQSISSKMAYPFYEFNNDLFFIGHEDYDTVLKITDKNITPYAILDLGNLKLPVRYRSEFSRDNFLKHGRNYFSITRISEDNRYLYITVGSRIKDDLYTHCIIFDKKSKSGFLTNGNDEIGIVDDILFGPNFWPIQMSDGYYVNYIEAYELIEKTENLENASEKFNDFIKSIDINTNQIIILCKKKKKL